MPGEREGTSPLPCSGHLRGAEHDGYDRMWSKRPNPDSYDLWHRRLGHIGDEKMRLLKTTGTGVTELAKERQKFCETCALRKSVRTINRKAPECAYSQQRRTRACSMMLIARLFGVLGPFSPPTPSGARYMLTFTDGFTHNVRRLAQASNERSGRARLLCVRLTIWRPAYRLYACLLPHPGAWR